MLFSGNQEPGQIDKLHKKVFVYFQEDYVNVILETYVEELIQGNNKLLVKPTCPAKTSTDYVKCTNDTTRIEDTIYFSSL
jgi:hypothetical protein